MNTVKNDRHESSDRSETDKDRDDDPHGNDPSNRNERPGADGGGGPRNEKDQQEQPPPKDPKGGGSERDPAWNPPLPREHAGDPKPPATGGSEPKSRQQAMPDANKEMEKAMERVKAADRARQKASGYDL